MVTLLVVVLLLTVVGGVVAVVTVRVMKMKKIKESAQPHSKSEDNPNGEVHNLYKNVQSQPIPTSGHSEPDYASAADAFINPASATVSFKTHMYEYANETDQRPTDIGWGRVYEEARVECGGGRCEESVKGKSGKQNKSLNVDIKIKREDLYAEPNKVKKKGEKKDKQVSRSEEAAAPSDDLYAQPDMTKKKTQKGQQDVEQERKLPPQAPLSYKKHKEAKHDSEEDRECDPDPPPPYVPDEKQYYSTRGEGGPSSSEKEYDYAVLDWQQK